MAEKIQDEKLSTRDLIKSCLFALSVMRKKARWYSVANFVYSLISGATPVVQAYLAGVILTELTRVPGGTANRARLLTFVLMSAAVNAASFALSNYTNMMFNAYRERLSRVLTGELLQKRTELKLEYMEMPELMDKFERADSGKGEVIYVSSYISRLVSSTVSILGTLTLVSATMPLLNLVIIPLPLLTIGFRVRNYRQARTSWKESRTERRRTHAIEQMFDSATSVMEMRLYGIVTKLVALWHDESSKLLNITLKNERKSVKSSLLIELFETLVGVGVDIWLVFRVFAGSIVVGAFEQNRRLIGTYISSLSVISVVIADLATDSYRLNDYRSFMTDELDSSYLRPKQNLKRLTARPGTIALKDVSFTYPAKEAAVINDINLDLVTTEHIAIVGENGAGKTTLLKLIMGLFTPTKGDVLIGGESSSVLDDESIATYVSPLMQDFTEFNFLDVKGSVAVGSPEKMNMARVKEVLSVVGLYDYFMKQPNKLDSTLGWIADDSLRLSGGQWQRLAIARALYKNADILILDEPTSAIDAKSEQDIIDAIFESYQGKMVIIVSHRLSTVKRAKRILVMKNGKLVEDGTHSELYKPDTVYYDLFHKQARALE